MESEVSSINQKELIQQAKSVPKEERKRILTEFPETEIHQYLKELFMSMEPNYLVEITHGVREFGKDLVIVKRDQFGIDVIGVIVKIGDIRAKTLGEVDELKSRVDKTFSAKGEKRIQEIESQIQQALAHPADMKAIFEKLDVSRVIVILAGEISNIAKKRIQGEFKDRIDIFDMDWLIEKFTQYYPQVFFEGKVIDFLQEEIQRLESNHKLSKSGKTLSEYFIEPPVLAIDIPIKWDEESLAVIVSQRKIPFLQLKSILINCKKLILVGDPGVGKSAAISKFTLNRLREAYSLAIKRTEKGKKIEIPVTLTAKEILEVDNANALLKTLFSRFGLVGRFRITILFVDALDEVSPEHRQEIVRRAEAICNSLNCCLAITSRKIEIIDTPPTGFAKYELLPFEFKQAMSLFEKLVTNEKTLKDLRDGLEKIRFQIPMVPLSLLLLLQLVEEHKEIPASVTELYDRFFDIELGRYDKEKGVEILFEYHIKKALLSELAYKEFFKKGRTEIPKDEFTKFLDDYASRYSWGREVVESFVLEIGRAGILDIKKMVFFRHRSFLDYFIAFYIFDRREEITNLDDYLVEIYFDDIWSDVAFFYIGLRREINETVLNKIFAHESENLFSFAEKFCSGRLLQAGWHSESKIKQNGIEKAISHAEGLRGKILSIFDKGKTKAPRIFGDFLMMSLSDFSFGSIFLQKEARILLNDLLRAPTFSNPYKALMLLWPTHRFMNSDELRTVAENFFQIIQKGLGLTQDELAVLLIGLMVVEKKDQTTHKSIKRKLDQIVKRDPSTFKKLLPYKKKGFR